MKNWLCSLGLLWFSLAWSLPQAYAREWFAVGGEFPGIIESTSTGEHKGLGVELVQLIVEQWGDTVRFETFPWARAQMMVQQGTADILVGAYKSPERESRFTFSRIPYFQDQIVFYRNGKEKQSWNGDYASLQARRVGYVLGWVYGESFESARPSLPLVKVTTVEDGVDRLVHKRLDLLAASLRDIEGWLSGQKNKPDIQVLKPLIGIQKGHFAFPKKPEFEAMRERFDKGLSSLVSHRRLEELAKKYKVEVPVQN